MVGVGMAVEEQAGTLAVRVRRGVVVALPLGLGALLVLLSFLWQTARSRGWEPASQQLSIVLNVDEDLSVMNWLTASTFLLAGLAVLALGRHQLCAAWWAAPCLGLGLLVASLSEAAPLHDPAVDAIAGLLGRGGLPAVLGAVLLLALVAGGLLLLRALDPAVARQLLVAGACLALAVVGVDRLDAADLDPAQRLALVRLLRVSAEEVLELLAAVLALDAVLRPVYGGRAVTR